VIEYFIIGIISFLTSAVSGLLGLGGAILLIPAYLYLPQALGGVSIDVKMITGITSVQVFVSSLIGMLMHKRKGAVNSKLVITMGVPITAASFLGAAYSAFLSPAVIIAVFAVLAVTGAVLMILKKEPDENSANKEINFNLAVAIVIALSVGFFGGIAGAPGAFILSPIIMTVLKMPTRITIGSTLGIVLLSSASASAGKIITGMVPFEITAAAVAASIPGVVFGSYFSYYFKTRTLRYILAVLIAAVAVEMWYRLVF